MPKGNTERWTGVVLLLIGPDGMRLFYNKELTAGAGEEQPGRGSGQSRVEAGREAGQESHMERLWQGSPAKLDGLAKGLPQQPGQSPYTAQISVSLLLNSKLDIPTPGSLTIIK